MSYDQPVLNALHVTKKLVGLLEEETEAGTGVGTAAGGCGR
jgi:hypothetical protein